MKFILIGIVLILCELAFPVFARSISSSAPGDIIGNIYKDNILLDNMKVHILVKKICSSAYWQNSPWSLPYGVYYSSLPDEGWYSVQIQAFQFGTTTFKSCPEFFYYDGTIQEVRDLHIISSCDAINLPC